MQIENKMALDRITPDKTKASRKANNKIITQAYSALVFKYNSTFSNINNFN